MSTRFWSPLSAAFLFIGAEAFILAEPSDADESVAAPSQDSQGSDAGSEKAVHHARPVSPIDKFLKGAVSFFGAEKLLGNDQANAAPAQEPPNPSLFTQDPSQKPHKDAASLEQSQDQNPTSPPPIEPVPAPSAVAGAAPVSPLFIVPIGIPGAQTINSIVDSPQVLSSQGILSNLINTVGWSATVNAVGVMEGYTTFASAVSNVEGVTLTSGLNLTQSIVNNSASFVAGGGAAGAASSGAAFWNNSLTTVSTEWTALQGTSLSDGLTQAQTSFGGNTFGSVGTALLGYWSSGLGLFTGVSGIHPPSVLVPAPATVPPPPAPGGPGGPGAPPTPVSIASMQRQATILSAAGSPGSQVSAISALNAVEGQISGQFVSRLPAITGSPSLYISKLFSSLKK